MNRRTRNRKQGGPRKQYWLTPPDVMVKLDDEFNFDKDMCPYPRGDHNCLKEEWGQSNFVNPPFIISDCAEGSTPELICKKAVEEYRKGKTCVVLLPAMDCTRLLVQGGAEVRDMGHIRWLEATTREPSPSQQRLVCAYILRPQILSTPWLNVTTREPCKLPPNKIGCQCQPIEIGCQCQPISETTDLISLADAGRLRGVSRQAISKLVKNDRLPVIRIGRHTTRSITCSRELTSLSTLL